MIKPGMTDLKPPLKVGETVQLKIERLVAGDDVNQLPLVVVLLADTVAEQFKL